MAFSSRLRWVTTLAALALLASVSCLAADPMGVGGGWNKAAEPGYLGIKYHDVNDGEVVTLHLKDRHGAEIVMVDHDGPAGKAGLREHDVVLSMNGVTVDGESQLRKMLHEVQPGQTVSLYICRDGSERTVSATLETKADVEKRAMENRWTVPSPSAVAEGPVAAPAEPASAPKGFAHSFMSGHLLSLMPAYTGASVDALGSQLAAFFGVKEGKGLLVNEVDENSPAAAAGLRAGDVVTKVNGNRVATEKDWSRALRDSKNRTVSLTVVRERKEQILAMVPDSKKRSAVTVPAETQMPHQSEPLPMIM